MMADQRVKLASRVLLVAGMTALLPALKGSSVTRPLSDPKACEDAIAAGASCHVCVSKFKMCRGHFVYEPFTVVLSEAFFTIISGILLTFSSVSKREATGMLLNFKSVRQVAPIGITYAFGDLMDLVLAKRVSSTTLIVASQMRLPLCALMRSVILGRGQTSPQWFILFFISLLCVGHVMSDIGPQATSSMGDGIIDVLPLVLGKCLISCSGAVHAEYFMHRKEVMSLPLWVTQVHFKFATMLGGVIVGFLQGRRGGRILATEWHSNLFTQIPPGVKIGDPRTPFFGGWDYNTWMLVVCLCANNFLIGDQLRHLTSISKYVAYALGMVLSYLAQLGIGGREFDVLQALCCGSIAVSAVAYLWLPSREKKD